MLKKFDMDSIFLTITTSMNRFSTSCIKRVKDLMLLIVFSAVALSVQAATYYSGGSGNPTDKNKWWSNTAGTLLPHPSNFTTAGDVFIVQATHTMSTPANWTVTGSVIVNGILSSNKHNFTFGVFTINSGGTVNVNHPFIVNGTTTVSGTINFSSDNKTARLMNFKGDVTLNSGAVWTEPASGNGANNTYNFAGNFTNNATTFTAVGTGLHTFSGTSKTISGSKITSIPNVAVTGSYTNNGTLTVTTALSGAGSLTLGTTGILNIGGTSTITTLVASAVGNTVNLYRRSANLKGNHLPQSDLIRQRG